MYFNLRTNCLVKKNYNSFVKNIIILLDKKYNQINLYKYKSTL